MGDAGEMNLGLESLKGFTGKMFQAALGFIGTLIFARELGPTDFGGFYFLLSIVFIVDRPLRGFGQAIEKRYSEAGADKRQLAGGAVVATAVAVTITGFVVFSLGDLLVAKTNLEEAPAVFMSLMIAFGVFFPVQKMMGAEGWVSKQTWNDTLRSLLTLLLQFTLVALGYGAAGMGYGLAAATLLVVPVGFYFVRAWPTIPSVGTLRSLWSFARYSTVSSFVGKAYDRFDVLLLGTLLTTGAAGNYEVAFKLTVPATFLAGVIASGLMPKISNRRSKGQSVADDVSNAVSYASMLAIPLFFGALALPKVIVVTAYGAEYASAATFLIGLACYQILFSQTQVYQHALSGLDLPNIRMKVNVVTLAFNLVSGVALLYAFDAVGVVVATVLAELLRYLLSLLAVKGRISSVNALPKAFVEQTVAGVVMFAAVEAGQSSMHLQSWVNVIALVTAGAVVYGIVLLTISPGLRFTLLSVYEDAMF